MSLTIEKLFRETLGELSLLPKPTGEQGLWRRTKVSLRWSSTLSTYQSLETCSLNLEGMLPTFMLLVKINKDHKLEQWTDLNRMKFNRGLWDCHWSGRTNLVSLSSRKHWLNTHQTRGDILVSGVRGLRVEKELLIIRRKI